MRSARPDVCILVHMTPLYISIAAYLVPTFILGFVWHLKLFDARYKALAIYRDDVIIPFGLLSMATQAVIFSYVYIHLIQTMFADATTRGLVYFVAGAVLSWSYTTVAVGAKHRMTSVPNFFVIETAFTVAQWALVAVATVALVG